jgi:hypothetical protein
VALNYATPDAHALAERARQNGARIVEGLANRPWNICQVVLLDPDGHRLVCNGPLKASELRRFDRIVQSAAHGFAPPE